MSEPKFFQTRMGQLERLVAAQELQPRNPDDANA